jgi:uncharacterized protein
MALFLPMRLILQPSFFFLLCFLFQAATPTDSGQPVFRVLAFYTDRGEPDHIAFANQALSFVADFAQKEHFVFASTTNWDDLDVEKLRNVRLVVWLNDFPKTRQQRDNFQEYMENGGRWLGFHVSAYNDADTKWRWFLAFLGGGVFHANNWPPLPAKLIVDDPSHPVTRRLGASLDSPANEWYLWKPSPRLNKDVKVLLTLAPENYPIGLKDTITGGDLPVVWTNTKYRMLYINMGHGDKIFSNTLQNNLIAAAVSWIVRMN